MNIYVYHRWWGYIANRSLQYTWRSAENMVLFSRSRFKTYKSESIVVKVARNVVKYSRNNILKELGVYLIY